LFGAIVSARGAFASRVVRTTAHAPEHWRARRGCALIRIKSWRFPVRLASQVAAVITDPLFYLLAIPAIVALGLGKGGFAGVGMISTPLLALTMPPLQAAAILLPILLCQDVISVWVYRRRWSAWNLKVLLPGSVVGVGAAWLFAAYVPNAYVEIAVGVTGVCFALYNTFGKVPAQPRRPSVPAGMFWGSLAGFTSTIIQVGAPPYQVHILPQRLDKFTLIGTTIIFFALVNVMKLVPYFALGQFSPRTLATSAVLLPFAVATNFLGLWLARRTPTELFYRITYLLMFLISLALIWQGASEIGAGRRITKPVIAGLFLGEPLPALWLGEAPGKRVGAI
jgi:uncharacterized protein